MTPIEESHIGSRGAMMCRRLFDISANSLVALVFLCAPALAQVTIENPHDARGFAMAGSGVADGSDPTTVLNNPALAGGLRGIYLLGYLGQVAGKLSVDQNSSGFAVSGGYQILQTLGLGGEVRLARESRVAYPVKTPTRILIGEFSPWEGYLSATAAADVRVYSDIHIQFGTTYKSWEAETGVAVYFPANPVVYGRSDGLWDFGA